MKNAVATFTFLFFSTISFGQHPRIVLGNLDQEGPYDRSEILLQERINIISANDGEYEIASYHFTILPNEGNPIRFEVEGERLTAKLQGALNQIVPGDKVVIENVVAFQDGDESNPIALEPITLEVKKFKGDGPYQSAWGSTSSRFDSTLYVVLGNLETNGLPVSKDELLAQDRLQVINAEDLDYSVTGFKMILAYKDRPPVMMSSNSASLTENMTSHLADLKSGDRILFEGIRAKATVDTEVYRVNLSPIIHTIK